MHVCVCTRACACLCWEGWGKMMNLYFSFICMFRGSMKLFFVGEVGSF